MSEILKRLQKVVPGGEPDRARAWTARLGV
jgi:hypothetical protein